MEKTQMVLILSEDKTTKGTVRYADTANHNLYLKHDEVAQLDNPKVLKVTLEKSS